MILLYKSYAFEYEYINSNCNDTILLLHGWGGNKDSFAKLKKILQVNFNILSISFPPLNIYKPPNQLNRINNISTVALDMYDYKNIVINILQLLNLKHINIICHSFGFRVALMLTTSKIVIEKIVITGGAGIRLKPNFFKKIRIQFNSIWLKKHPEDFYKIASSEYSNLSHIDQQTFKNIINKDLTKYIKLLPCKTFLFWGKKDTETPIRMFKIIKKIKPNLLSKIIDKGTHFCYLEQSNIFIDCCQNFLIN